MLICYFFFSKNLYIHDKENLANVNNRRMKKEKNVMDIRFEYDEWPLSQKKERSCAIHTEKQEEQSPQDSHVCQVWLLWL